MNSPFSPGSGSVAYIQSINGNGAAQQWRIEMFAQSRSLSFAAVLAVASFVTLSGSAAAAVPCGKRDDIVKSLQAKYQETRRIMAIVNAKTVMEIFASKSGSWTVLMSTTDGRSCLTASGEAWSELPHQVAGLES
jgi:predicted lipoprotein